MYIQKDIDQNMSLIFIRYTYISRNDAEMKFLKDSMGKTGKQKETVKMFVDEIEKLSAEIDNATK